MKKSTIIQLLAGVLIAAAGMYFFFKDVNPAELWNEIHSTSVLVLIGVALLSPLSLWFRALRWKIILPSGEKSSLKELFPLVMIGFMVNNILPARLGEAARAFLLWKKNGYTVAESIGSLIVERLIDILTFMTFFFIPIFFSGHLSSLYTYGILFLSGFTGICIIVVIYRTFPEPTAKFCTKSISVLPDKIRKSISKIGQELVSNINWIFSLKKVVAVFLLSILTALCYAAMMMLLGNFGILDSMFGVAFAAMGAAIPLAPGYVGTLHATLLHGLGLAGVPADKAGAIAVLYHAIGYITVTAIGLYYFFSIKLSFKDLRKVKQDLSDEQ